MRGDFVGQHPEIISCGRVPQLYLGREDAVFLPEALAGVDNPRSIGEFLCSEACCCRPHLPVGSFRFSMDLEKAVPDLYIFSCVSMQVVFDRVVVLEKLVSPVETCEPFSGVERIAVEIVSECQFILLKLIEFI